jgi:glutathionyl-hydroquinone reductase
VNLVRHLKGLTSVIDVSIVKAYPKGNEKGWPGWQFPGSDDEYPSATVDKLYGSAYLHDIYFKADKYYKGWYSVPVLWDMEVKTIVNNESYEILRWLPNAFNLILPDEFCQKDFYPSHLHQRIDEVSPWVQKDLNKGVYAAGFAQNQEAYDKAVVIVFEALNRLEQLVHSNGGPYILGDTLTELDLLAYLTLIRFDVVYHEHFKCNLGSIRHNYPVLNNYLRNLYWNVPGFKETTNFKHITENVSCYLFNVF